jgi:DNA helicase-2/ATP-dependent DNA helicase PcrA
MDEFENLAGFLEHISLVMEGTEGSDGPMVNVMTLHGAKGLEFETVFLPGWEEGLFRHQRALDEGGISALEEERRLAYVGLTRAKKKAIVSFVANRRIHNLWQSSIPSRFVDELPADHVERESEPGIYGGGQGGGMAEEGIATYAARPGPQLGAWRSRSASGPRRATAPFIEGKAREIETSAAAAARFQVGTRIFHQKFGYGRIKTVEGTRLEIDFEKAGIKKVIDSFVEKV